MFDCWLAAMKTLEILIAGALFLGTTSAASLGVVTTEGGLVKGKNYKVGLFHSMDVFKGIPFADKTELFEKPKPHPGWDGVRKATQYAPRCLQVNFSQTGTRGSTDCLYLNIWVPHGLKVSRDLPVMVWIYGGAFMLGGSMGVNFLDNYLYDGEEIADRGKVIVVSVAYRVGTLGFLSSGDASGPGNYGLWDQHAAIAWVHRNIRNFGGDPDNITLFGESAGGASVSFQMVSPHNKGMIKRAISQSGVSVCPWAINKNPRVAAVQVAQKVGCPIDDRMMACLRMTDAATLTLAGSLNIEGNPTSPIVNNLVLTAVVDGDFLPDHPANLFHNAADIDYIGGVNDMDGHLFAGVDIPSINSPITATSVEDVLALLGALTKEKGHTAVETVTSLYTKDWGSKPSQETIKRTVVEIETDYIFLAPTQEALYRHASNARTGRTYSYVFSEPNRMGGLGKPFPGWMGADHADDLQYVFGKPFSTPVIYWPKYRDLSRYFISYWTNFAQTGDPNHGHSKVPVKWPQFTDRDQYLEIQCKMNTNNIKQSLRLKYVHFWSGVFPSLPTVPTLEV